MEENNAGLGQYVWGNIKNRFMIVLVLSILVSSALSSLYNVSSATASMSYLAILTPVFYIVAYVLFEMFKTKLHDYFLVVVSRELLAGILSFVFPLIFVAFFKTVATLGFLMKVVLFVAIWGVPLVSIAIFLSVLFAGLMALKK